MEHCKHIKKQIVRTLEFMLRHLILIEGCLFVGPFTYFLN